MRRVVLLLAAMSVAVLAASGVAVAQIGGVPDEGTAQVDGQVRTVLAVGDRVYIGGDFTHVDGVSRNYLAAIDATTGELVQGWNPNPNAGVRSLAASADGSRLYVGGHFTAIGGLNRQHLAAIDASTGAVDGQWNVPVNASVRGIALVGNRLYVGGDFSTVKGINRTRLALVDALTGELNPNWVPTANNVVQALDASPDGSRIYAGGDFTSVSGRSKPYLASIDAATGALDAAFQNPSPNGKVIDLSVADTRVYTAEGGTGGAAGAYNAATGARSWQARTDGNVQALAVLGGEVYLGGHFDFVNGQTRHALAAVDASTGALDGQWIPSASPVDPGVWAMTASTSPERIYAGGDFTSISGQPRQRFAQFTDASGTSVDTAPPETTITSGPPAASNSTSASFGFSSTESGSAFGCSLDGAPYSPCTSPKTYDASLLDGSHTFSVRATDPAGNTDPTPASRTWTVDTVAPAVPVIADPPDNATTAASFALSGTAEAGSTVEVFDGALSVGTTRADASGAWSRALSNVSGGLHTYTARATDDAGNTSGSSDPRTVNVDATVPDTTITSGPSGTVSSRDATFGFSSTESGSTFECSLDGAPYSRCSSPQGYTGLSNGSHTFRVRATDASGNTDPTPASRTWKVQLSGKTK